MRHETLNQERPDEENAPGMTGRRCLLKLAAGLVAGGLASGLVIAPQSLAQPASGRRILIAYFSRTGTTREVANQIRARIGGELFELKTAHS